MIYTKEKAQETQGLAILCMCMLHLWCRQGSDIFGQPLIMLTSTMPLVYLFGFFSEIVPALYSIVAGYAQARIFETASYKDTLRRILKLMVNYWIVLVLVSVIGLITRQDSLPGSIWRFIKCVFLLDSYNGAWWYLHSYVFLMLIPAPIRMYPMKKIKSEAGLAICALAMMAMYFVAHFHLYYINESNGVLRYITTEIYNLIRILPAFYAGAFVCKGKVFDLANTLVKEKVTKGSNLVLCGLFALTFIGVAIVRKAIIMEPVALVVFVLFNLIRKPVWLSKVFLFLGKHNTNIWLTHMFFYLTPFTFVIKAKYPVLILISLLAVCIVFSYVVMGIQKGINRVLDKGKV